MATAELTLDPQDTSHPRFSNFNSGPFVVWMRRAIDLAEQLEPVRDGRYELRGLRVPSLHVAAFWLHNLRSGPNDRTSDLIILPVRSASEGPGHPPGLAPDVEKYPNFLASLVKSARDILARPDRTLGG